MQMQIMSKTCVTVNTRKEVKIQVTNWEKVLADYKTQKTTNIQNI